MRQLSRPERVWVAALMNHYEHSELQYDPATHARIAQAINARRMQDNWQIMPDVAELADDIIIAERATPHEIAYTFPRTQ